MATTMFTSAVDPAAVAALAAEVSGPVLLRDDPRWAAEIAGFNPVVVRDPEVVVGATDAADVAAAVRWAVAQGMPVGVLATGTVGPRRPRAGC